MGLLVVPGVFAASAPAWRMHPAHYDKGEAGPVTDCTHYCVVGDGRHGLWEGVNRRWLAHLLHGAWD